MTYKHQKSLSPSQGGNMRIAVLALVLAIGVRLAGGQQKTAQQTDTAFLTGQKLLGYCSQAVKSFDDDKTVDIAEANLCIGYVAGALDMERNIVALSKTWTPHVCYPKNGTVEQAVRVVVKYLRDNPEGLHYSAGSTIWVALMKAFPCKI
jgi:Rap1a immunity proteins